MERPILFNTPMVQAILNGQKTSTRRIAKFKPYTSLNETNGDFEICEPVTQNFFKCRVDFEKWAIAKCRYKVGDILWVRETWLVDSANDANKNMAIDFKAIQDGYHGAEVLCDFKPDRYKKFRKFYQKKGWQSSLFMPKEAARILLKVTDVRTERLHDITHEQILKEGTNVIKSGYDRDDYEFCWINLWEPTCTKEEYKWNSNPWVWVIEFKKQ